MFLKSIWNIRMMFLDFGKFDCVMLKLIEMYSCFNIELCICRLLNGFWEMKICIGFVMD